MRVERAEAPENETDEQYWHRIALENMDRDTEPADRWYEEGWCLWSESKHGPWVPTFIEDKKVDGKWVRTGPTTGFMRKGNDPSEPRLLIEDAANIIKPGEEVKFGPWGHLIAEDGTVYTLVGQYTHGVVMACLHPDVATKWGYMPPVAPLRHNNVFHYQHCEFQISDMVNMLRISVGGMAYSFNVSKPRSLPTSDIQVERLRQLALAHGHKIRDKIHTSWGEVSVQKALTYMKER